MKVRCGNKNCKKYIDRDGAVRGGLSYYCDGACRMEGSNGFSGKKKSTTTKIASKPKRPKVSHLDQGVLERDKFVCRLCGGTNNLAIHHINYRGEIQNKAWENESWNLITLCNEPCHLTIVHGNKKKYKRLLLALTWYSLVENKFYTFPEVEEQFKEEDDDEDN